MAMSCAAHLTSMTSAPIPVRCIASCESSIAGVASVALEEPADAPRRRFYRLTPEGSRNLDELAAVITATRDSHAAFLHAYKPGFRS